MADPLMIPADAERLLSAMLRSDPDVQGHLGDRVYTVMPREKVYPLAVLTRWGTETTMVSPIAVETADVQIDVYGDRKKQAQDAAQMIRAVLAQRLPAGSAGDGWITEARTSDLRYLPDEQVDPPRARYVLSARLVCRSAALAAP